MRINNGDVELEVVVDGADDAPPVLLLHGITGSTRTWDWFVPRLVDRYRVLRLDFRGHGASSHAPGTYLTDGWVSDAAAAVREVAGRPVAVVGHSLGGGTAAGLAQRHPDLVRGIALEDPALGVPASAGAPSLDGNSLLDAFRMMRESVPRLQESGITEEVLVGVLAAAPTTTGRTFGEQLHPDAIAAMASALLTLDASVLDPVLSGTSVSLMDPDVTIPVPVLVVAADPSSPDCVARPVVTDHLQRVTPHADVRVLPGSGHLIHDDLVQREPFADLVIAFLDGLD